MLDHLARIWVKACELTYSISVLEYEVNFRGKKHLTDDLEKLRIKLIMAKQKNEKRLEVYKKAYTDLTASQKTFTLDNKTFNSYCGKTKHKVMINSLEEVGWPELKFEKDKMPKRIDNSKENFPPAPIYPEWKYAKYPRCMHIPHDRVILMLMRATIGVKTPD